MKIGRFEISTFVEHELRLDGGAMFGVIPRSMWEKLIKPDDANLIPMVNNLFVLKAHGKNILFDAGFGDTLTDREKKIYGVTGQSNMSGGLKSLGLTEDDIDLVVLTHLHTDHAAGALKLDGGKFIPRFPQAKVIVSQREWQDALEPNERTSAIYDPQRCRALEEAGVLERIKPDLELLPGIKAVHTGGHTPGHFGLEIESEGQKLFYYADIFCISHHMKIPFIPALDLDPTQSMNVRRSKLPEIIEDQVIMAFVHDTEIALARITGDEKKLSVQSLLAVN